MLIGREKNISIPIESYSKQLIYYLHYYLKIVDVNLEQYSLNENDKAKIYLRWTIFRDREFKKDYDKVKDKIGIETLNMVREYTTCIMQLLGKVAECIVIDRCINDKNTNRICINIATYKPDIYEKYPDIGYDDYLAFSPSYKFILCYNENGRLEKYNVPDYNPLHTSKDIAWCKRNNILSQLKTEIPELNYLENAKLQIKTFTNYRYVNLNSYIATPIVCFDLGCDIKSLQKKYPKHIIISARYINEEMFFEIEHYFKILAAYATGIIDKVNITDKDVVENYELEKLLRTPVLSLIKENNIDCAGIIDMLQEYKKPIIIEG